MNTTEQTSSLPSAGGENGVKLLLKYFPDLTEEQRKQFAALYELYIDWNSKINVISRKDIENLYEHHVLHSLGIARIIRFRAGSSVMDLGTGGGFPGIPLAILFPDTKFHLVDSIGKKVRVATEVKCHFPPCTGRRRETNIRLRCQPCRDAPGRPDKDYPEKHLAQTAKCSPQRTYLPERRRTGTRGDAV